MKEKPKRGPGPMHHGQNRGKIDSLAHEKAAHEMHNPTGEHCESEMPMKGMGHKGMHHPMPEKDQE